eukprot:159946-Chlamydomonas_euryale.AAC.4
MDANAGALMANAGALTGANTSTLIANPGALIANAGTLIAGQSEFFVAAMPVRHVTVVTAPSPLFDPPLSCCAQHRHTPRASTPCNSGS